MCRSATDWNVQSCFLVMVTLRTDCSEEHVGTEEIVHVKLGLGSWGRILSIVSSRPDTLKLLPVHFSFLLSCYPEPLFPFPP